MLPRQDLGRGHQRGLPARTHRHHRSQCGNDRLAAAHVTLQQPVHGLLPRQIGRDLVTYPALRPGERKRQRGQQRRLTVAIRQRLPPLARPQLARPSQRQLLRHQLFQDDALAGRRAPLQQSLQISPWWRMMDEPQRFQQWWKPRQQRRHRVRARPSRCLLSGTSPRHQRRQQRWRQRVLPAAIGQSPVDLAAQRGLAQTGHGGINGRQPVRQRRVLAHHPVARMHHLAAKQPHPQLAIGAHQPPRLQLRQLGRIEMQEAQLQLAGTVVHPDLQRAPAPRHLGPGDSGLDLGRTAVHQRADRHQPGLVLVAQRQVQHQVVRPVQPQPGQQRSRRAATGRRLGCPLGGTPAGSLLARCFCALHGGACLAHVLHRACRADRKSLTPAPAWLPPRKARPWAAPPPGRWNVPDTVPGNTRP